MQFSSCAEIVQSNENWKETHGEKNKMSRNCVAIVAIARAAVCVFQVLHSY